MFGPKIECDFEEILTANTVSKFMYVDKPQAVDSILPKSKLILNSRRYRFGDTGSPRMVFPVNLQMLANSTTVWVGITCILVKYSMDRN